MDKVGYMFNPTTKAFIGMVGVQESPLEPGIWLFPPNTTDAPPPASPAGKTAIWLNNAWSLSDADPSQLPNNPAEPIQDIRQTMIVSRYQGRAALLNAGLLNEVEAYFNSTAATQLEKLAWEDVTEFYRLSPLVVKMGQLLSQTDAQLDQLFTSAAMIRA